jgi:hypothetical protein
VEHNSYTQISFYRIIRYFVTKQRIVHGIPGWSSNKMASREMKMDEAEAAAELLALQQFKTRQLVK